MSDGGKPYRDNVTQFPKHKLQQFKTISPTQWDGVEPEPVDWLVHGLVARRSVAMFSGDSGLGKSQLMLQLQACMGAGKQWLGFDVARGRSLGFYCEDPEQILQWRMRKIVQHLGITEADLDDVLIAVRAGMDNTLIDFHRYTEAAQTTIVFDQLKREALDFGAELTIIDTLANTFNGNESSRTQATRFVNGLLEIAEATNGAVILCAHPSVASMLSGTGFSGSTAWKASVRSQMYLTRPKDYNDENPDAEHDIRLLKTKKANWGQDGGIIKLKWMDGVFDIIDDERKDVSSTPERIAMDNAIIHGMKYFMEKGDHLSSEEKANNNVVTMLIRLPSLKAYGRSNIGSAVDRLCVKGRLTRVDIGPPSRRRRYVRPTEDRYLDEG